MKKESLTIVIFIITCFFTFSCQKVTREEHNSKTEEGRMLTDEQLNFIGEKHNEYLEIVLERSRFAEDKVQAVIFQKQRLEEELGILPNNYSNKEVSITSKKTEEVVEVKTTKENLQAIKNNLVDKNDFIYFQKVLNFLESDKTEKNVETISAFIEKIKNEMIVNNINSLDYETFLVFGTVLKSSAKFWLPTDLGGQDKFAFYRNESVEGVSFRSGGLVTNKKNWKDCLSDVLEADGSSAASGFIAAAVVAGATGGALGVPMLIEVAAGSGISSAYGYFRSNRC